MSLHLGTGIMVFSVKESNTNFVVLKWPAQCIPLRKNWRDKVCITYKPFPQTGYTTFFRLQNHCTLVLGAFCLYFVSGKSVSKLCELIRCMQNQLYKRLRQKKIALNGFYEYLLTLRLNITSEETMYNCVFGGVKLG